MHSSVPLLINITIALVVAFFGGMLARRIGLPTIVGYLLTGIVIGPFTPGFVGDIETIQQLAELGVIFLMLGVGLHFSFAQLMRVRDIAIAGALIQTLLATLAGVALTRLWGWSVVSGVTLGLSISVASTVVLLRGLMDNRLLNTTHGQVAVGWLVMEDILSVLILVLMPVLSVNGGGFNFSALGLTLVKAAAFVLIMFVGGKRLIPWLLERVALTRSRELFILVVLAISLGTAMAASELFGVSLALGAFVAGAIISESHLSHQVGADVFSFREAFSVLFFVSVGMLVNPLFLWQNLGQVLSLTLLVVVGKLLIVLMMGMFFPRPARTFLVVAVGLSQIGEFSFIIGQGGLALGLLDTNQYALILAASLISITINPFMYRLLPPLERFLRHMPGLWRKLESSPPIPPLPDEGMRDHVVIVGYGRVGKHLFSVLDSLHTPLLIIEDDLERIDEINQLNIPTLYGDAANSEVLTYASLERAKVLVCTLPDETATALVVANARAMAPQLTIVARAASIGGVNSLAQLGANHVVQPELEGGLELVHHTLLRLGYPLREVHQFAEAFRRDNYDTETMTDEEHRSLHDLLMATDGIDISWMMIGPGSPLVGQTLAEANIRSRTGASVAAMIRDNQVTANPKSQTVFASGDRIGLIGEAEQIRAVQALVDGAAVTGETVQS